MATKKKMLQAAAGVGGVPEGAWDLSYAYYNDPLAWDVSSSNYKSQLRIFVEGAARGVFFKPDGTKMYIVGSTGDAVHEYSLGTAWLIQTGSFVRTFSVATQTTVPTNLFFKPDGTKMYVVGSNSDAVYEYDLSTAWNISTASFLQSFSVTTQETTPEAIFFKPDGTKMYIAGSSGDDVNEYDLSTAWDISTAVFLQLFSLAPYGSSPQGLSFKADGTKMYFAQLSGTYEGVVEYDLSTAWDVSTASYSKNFVTTAIVGTPTGLFFNPDGTGFYITDYGTDRVYQYNLGGFSVVAQEYLPVGLSFKPDGTKMYVVGGAGNAVDEYDLSTAWDTSSSSFLQSFSVSAQETSCQALFFKPDGTKMYITGGIGDDVNEYNLSTAWDVSTAVFLQLFSVSAQELSPSGIFFKTDGTKMYISGASGRDVNEYNLSTAWDVTTASFMQNFSVNAQETAPSDLFFKSDGTKMYITGSTGDDVNEYDLSTAWDISTSAYLQNFSVAAQETSPGGLFFKDDGTQMFVVGQTSDRVYTYSLGVQE